MKYTIGSVIPILSPNCSCEIIGNKYSSIIWRNDAYRPTEEEIQAKIAELEAAEPLRLLRIERDKLLAATDWRFRIDQEPSQAWYEYCQALRDLPQEIENGIIPAPTLDENGMLVFEHWPERIQ